MTSSPEKLLYVEDEPIVALVVEMALEEAGFCVEHAVSGKAAIKALQDGPAQYAALVTDVRMPEVDGWETARRARELNSNLPVVYVSGDSASEWSANGVAGSIMIQKPFSNAQLVRTLSTLLNR